MVAPGGAARRPEAVLGEPPARPFVAAGGSPQEDRYGRHLSTLRWGDVPKRAVVACVVSTGPEGVPSQTIRALGTMPAALLALADWLTTQAVRHVALESPGGSWTPIGNLVEEHCALLLVTARPVKAGPERTTAVRDCAWLAEVLRHGLLTGSVVPDRPHREWRALPCYPTSLVRARTAAANRLQQTLEGANITLAAVAPAILGASGRDILAALVAGETDRAQLAPLAHGRWRETLPQLAQALVGRVGPHQHFLVAQLLAPSDCLAERSARVRAESAERVRPDEEAIAWLAPIPGIGRAVAEVLVAEIGTDLPRFPRPQHLASWAGPGPGNHARAGQRRSGKTGQGSPWLQAGLGQAAPAAARTTGT
jgi:transposase